MLRPVSRVFNKSVIDTIQNQACRILASERPTLRRRMTTATEAVKKIEIEEIPNRAVSVADIRTVIDEQHVVRPGMPDPCILTFRVSKMIKPDKVHINFEDLPSELHEPFVKRIMNDIVELNGQGAIQDIQFNNVSESAFRYCLNMPIRRMGYKSTFTKYNHERGLACFERLPDKITLTCVGRFNKSPYM
ncbi:uncharacterized protein LOC127842679 [Dreissena polymorpha]|uniref:Uncharacterized protein n=1 Tax=Dreissena polymorpha TaxID=45954 RepID=A0A9D4N2A8_DREPO|nr:uncharacterized protein LOC127842679 [Dreissena polymorpha]KAH3886510.1 hypothetical protein DPMN_010521 [Dreissena polymorpha]